MQEINQKYRIFQAISKSFYMTTDYLKIFLKLCGIFALVMSVLSFIFSQSFGCLVPGVQDKILCGENVAGYVVYIVLKFFMVAVFLRVWADKIYLKKDIGLIYFKENGLRFVKFFGVFAVFLVLNVVPFLSLYLLIIRTPNPIWQIEILYFFVVSLGFFVPFVLMRFYANIGLWIAGSRFTDFKKTYRQTNFQTSRILTAFTVILAFCLFLFLILQGYLKHSVFEPLFLYNIFAEYVFEWGLLFMASIMFNFIMIQKDMLPAED